MGRGASLTDVLVAELAEFVLLGAERGREVVQNLSSVSTPTTGILIDRRGRL